LNLLKNFQCDTNSEVVNEDQRQLLKLYKYEKELKVNIEKILHNYICNDEINLTGSQINVANGCNLNCRYCFADGGTHGKSNRMSLETSRKVIDFIKENHKGSQELNLSIIGGEPLINEDTFEEIAHYSSSVFKPIHKEVKLKTTTNGTLMNDNIKRIFNKYNISYMVSLDSNEKNANDFLRPSKDNKSTYDKIWRNYFMNKDKNKDIYVHVTVTPYNKNISEIANSLFDLGINKIVFAEVKSDNDDLMFTEKDVEILKREYEKITEMIIDRMNYKENVVCYPIMNNLKSINKRKLVKFKCGVLSNFVAFDPKGDIYPCDMLMWDKYCVGNISNGIDKTKLKEMKKILADEKSCKVCWARYLCGGECLSERLWENEQQRYFRCQIKRHIYKLRIYLYDYIIKNHKNFNFDLYEFMEEK
jgi:uncharacterized protein